MININNLCLSFNKEFNILDNINLNIGEQEKVAIIGKSGSGKTCLLRALLGLEEFQSGEISLNGKTIKNISQAPNLSIGYIPKNPVLLNNKTVKQNLEYVLKIRKIDKSSINFKLLNALKAFDIESIRNFNVNDLSLYHKYLVSLARVSQRKVDIFIIDDICSKLSLNEQSNIVGYFKMLLNSYPESTFIFSFTDEELAKSLGLRIVKIENGKLI